MNISFFLNQVNFTQSRCNFPGSFIPDGSHFRSVKQVFLATAFIGNSDPNLVIQLIFLPIESLLEYLCWMGPGKVIFLHPSNVPKNWCNLTLGLRFEKTVPEVKDPLFLESEMSLVFLPMSKSTFYRFLCYTVIPYKLALRVLIHPARPRRLDGYQWCD